MLYLYQFQIIFTKKSRIITSKNLKTGVNVVALVNRFNVSSVKSWTAIFSIHASKSPVIIMNQLKSVYNSPLNPARLN